MQTLDPRCQATIDRGAFDAHVQSFAELAALQRSANFASLDSEPGDPGMTRRTYHFEHVRSAPRPRTLITVPVVDESGRPCGLIWDHAPATTIRELHEPPLVEATSTWVLATGQEVEVYEVVERPVEKDGCLIIIKTEPLGVHDDPSRAPELAAHIAREARSQGWEQRFTACADGPERTPVGSVLVRFVNPTTFDGFGQLVAWADVADAG